jgi:uncharacterized membrane protein YccC
MRESGKRMRMAAGNTPFWVRRRTEIRLSVRITVAGLASFALAHAFNLPQGYWAVFTAVLVVQASVGGSLKFAVDRLIGTLGGAVFGAVTAILVPHDDVLMLGVTLAVALAPLALLSALNPSFRVAPITAVILLLGSSGATEGPVLAAVLRTLEVSLGGLVGMAVSLLVLPARAHWLMGDAAGRTLVRLADLLEALIDALSAPSDAGLILARQDAARKSIAALETISDEAARERRNYLSDDADPEPVTRTLRRVRHDLILIGRVAAEPLPEAQTPPLKDSLAAFKTATAAFLRNLGNAFMQRSLPPDAADFDRVLLGLLADLDAIPGHERLVALGFVLEQFQRNCGDLSLRAQEFAKLPKAAKLARA